jgi:hypothetical protein
MGSLAWSELFRFVLQISEYAYQKTLSIVPKT